MAWFPLVALYPRTRQPALLESLQRAFPDAVLRPSAPRSASAGTHAGRFTELITGAIHLRIPTQTSGEVFVEFLDFPEEVYDQDGPTPSQAGAKRQAAIHALAALIRGGARLAWLAGAEDNYAGQPDHYETSSKIFDALEEPGALTPLLRRPLYFWLMACRTDDVGLAPRLLQRPDTQAVATPPDIMVVEEVDAAPLFADRLRP